MSAPQEIMRIALDHSSSRRLAEGRG
ncbi:MAG: hypothetical protein MGAcid_15910 [uncultured Acidilobus sp. MG]|nr:MAG: hypothetical protein MGAcid_15910 [uncultured Acidilobus sp. MG]